MVFSGELVRTNHRGFDIVILTVGVVLLLPGLAQALTLWRSALRFAIQRQNILLLSTISAFIIVPKTWYRVNWESMTRQYNLDLWSVSYRLVKPDELAGQLRIFVGSVVPTLFEGRIRRVLAALETGGQSTFPLFRVKGRRRRRLEGRC